MNEIVSESRRTMKSDGITRLVYIDALRAIAALSVVFVHVAAYLARQPDSPYLASEFKNIVLNRLDLGIFGVALFFFISGFVVPFSLLAGKDLLQFWVHRTFRLYPPFWISLLAVLGVDWCCGGGGYVLPRLLANITMVPQIFGSEPMSGIYWTLFVEMIFYIFCSVLYALGVLGRLGITASAVIALAALTAIPVFLNEVMGTHFPVKYLPLHLSYLFAGTLVRLCIHDPTKYRWKLLAFVMFVQALLLALATGVFFDGPPGFGFFTRQAIFFAYIAASICFIFCVVLRTPQHVILLRVGASSYSLYLLHWPVIAVLVAVLPGSTPDVALSLVLLSTLLSLLVAEVAYRLFERPSIRMGRVLGSRLANTGHAPV